jgi:hypothetical protein
MNMNKGEDKYRKQGQLKKILKILRIELEIKLKIGYIMT